MENKKQPQFEKVEDGKKDHYKNHLFPANFETFDFEKLKKEIDSDEYNGVFWENNSNLKVEKDDIVYVYYINLPDRINRILLKFEVIEPVKKYKNQTGILLNFQTAMSVEDKKKDKFSEKKLREEYGINNFQGKQHLKEDFLQRKIENGEQDYYQKKLINDLEKENNKNQTISLDSLIEYMNTISQCALQIYPKFSHENHSTFVKENGLNYYEQHHLIQQFNRRNNPNFPEKIINDPRNIINLCPNCHRRIHNGKKEDREKIITYLYEKHKGLKELLAEIPKDFKQNTNSDKEWLLQQYINKKQDKDI